MDKEQIIAEIITEIANATISEKDHRYLANEYAKKLANLKVSLAEAEKLKVQPKHLDYGLYQFQEYEPVEAVYINMARGLVDVVLYLTEAESGTLYATKALENGKFLAIHGNLADDLKAVSEPLKSFGIGERGNRCVCKIASGHLVTRNITGGGVICVEAKDIHEFILKLGRLVYTAEQEKK